MACNTLRGIEAASWMFSTVVVRPYERGECCAVVYLNSDIWIRSISSIFKCSISRVGTIRLLWCLKQNLNTPKTFWASPSQGETMSKRLDVPTSSCIQVCVLSSHLFWTSDMWTHQPRSHRISPPSFCGACLNFSREKDSAVPFPRRPWSRRPNPVGDTDGVPWQTCQGITLRWIPKPSLHGSTAGSVRDY